MASLYTGFKVFLRHIPAGQTDLLFNGNPILDDKVCVILEDSRSDPWTPAKTCLGYLDFLSADDTVLSFTAIYQNDFEFKIRQNFSEESSFFLETQFRVYNGASFEHPVSFLCEQSASTFWGLVFGGGSATVDLSSLNDLLYGIDGKLDSLFAVPPSNFLDLNGNCGTFKNGTVVNVTDKEGDYIVRSSQIFWNDITSDSNMIIYYLEQDGCFMNAPSCYVTKKKVV